MEEPHTPGTRGPMAPLTLRVRTPARMLRVTVDGDATVAALRAAVAKELAVAPRDVGALSLTPTVRSCCAGQQQRGMEG